MKRKRRAVGFIGFIIFVAFVLVTGYALNAAGYDDNPFPQITFLTNSVNGDGGRFQRQFTPNTDEDAPALPSLDTSTTGLDLTGANSSASSGFQLPSVSDLSSSDAAATASNPGPEAFGSPGRDDQNSISWSDFGDVLYDLWFICATTAIFIVVQYVFKSVLKQFKRRSPRVAAAQAQAQ